MTHHSHIHNLIYLNNRPYEMKIYAIENLEFQKMDNKQQYPQGYGYGAGAPYPAAPAAQGFGPMGAFPQTGFAGPGYPVQPGYGPGVQQAGFSQQPQQGFMPPPMGFHMPINTGYTDERPKPYSNESGTSFGDNGMDFSERSIRMAFIRYVRHFKKCWIVCARN